MAVLLCSHERSEYIKERLAFYTKLFASEDGPSKKKKKPSTLVIIAAGRMNCLHYRSLSLWDGGSLLMDLLDGLDSGNNSHLKTA